MRPGRAQRFWSKVSPEPNSGCWLWTAALGTHGYGSFMERGGPQKAHRVAWGLSRGEIPSGLHVLHHCDNRACVNPDHLRLGTNADNIADKVSRNRGNQPRGDQHWTRQRPVPTRGERNGMARMTRDRAEHIRVILSAGVVRQKDVAAAFGVALNVVRKINRGTHWALAHSQRS